MSISRKEPVSKVEIKAKFAKYRAAQARRKSQKAEN